MKKKIKDVAARLIDKRVTYTDSLRPKEMSFSVGYVEYSGQGDWSVYPTRHSNGIYIPREVIGELLQFGEVKRERNLGDGDTCIENWRIEDA